MRYLAAAAVALALSTLTPRAGALSVRENATGAAISWRVREVNLHLEPGAEDLVPGAYDALQLATDHWGVVPDTTRVWAVPGSEQPVGFTRGGVNENTVHFVTDVFPYDTPALAVTVVTADTNTGAILDTDVLVDLTHNQFARLGPEGMLGVAGAPFDLENTLTHEMGHVLGLGEDYDTPAATMYPTARPGEVSKRYLADVDRESARLAYVQADLGGTPGQRGGCGGNARVSPRAGTGSSSLLLAVTGLCLLALVAWRARVRPRARVAVFAAGLMVAGAAVPDAAVRTPPARVLSATSAWRRGAIWTRATVQDADGATRVVDVPGGRVGGVEQRVFHTTDGAALAPGGAMPAAE